MTMQPNAEFLKKLTAMFLVEAQEHGAHMRDGGEIPRETEGEDRVAAPARVRAADLGAEPLQVVRGAEARVQGPGGEGEAVVRRGGPLAGVEDPGLAHEEGFVGGGHGVSGGSG